MSLERRLPRYHYPLWHPYSAMDVTGSPVVTLVKGHGCTVHDAEGHRYLDATAGLWSVHCGLGDPDIIAAITEQLQTLSYATLFDDRGNLPALTLARRLVEMAPSPLEWVYLTGSGSESVELAIKLARLVRTLRGDRQKREIVYVDRSYHGTFFGSMGVSALVDHKRDFSPLLPGLTAIAAPDPARCAPGTSDEAHALACASELDARARRGGVSAFIIEPVLGSAGVLVPPRAYFEAIQDICRSHDILLIVDEVATGFGRTGTWFACEQFGIQPDILLVAKGINSGYLPLGAVLFSDAIGSLLLAHQTALGHGSTHNGNPVCCAAALATLSVIERDGLVERAARMGEYFRDRLQTLRMFRCVGEVRSLGLMLGLPLRRTDGTATTSSHTEWARNRLRARGVLAYAANDALVFCPPFIVSQAEIDAIVEALRAMIIEEGMADGVAEVPEVLDTVASTPIA